ncbi:hypothetical protein NUM3379_41680 [Kineococcus sp. NUM-3379]
MPTLRTGRELHCLDVENLLGGPFFTRADVEALRGRWLREVAGDRDVLVTLATSSAAGLLAAGTAWPGARLVWLPGRDGADRALLEVLEEDVAARFERVVVGSGDGAFTASAARLAEAGCEVAVVGPRGGVAGSLRLAAHSVTEVATRLPHCSSRAA